MRSPNPRQRYEDLTSKRTAPVTDIERSLFVTLHGKEALGKLLPNRPWTPHCIVDPTLEYPLYVFRNESIKSILEAFLIASNNDFEVSEAIAMPPEEVSAYRALFFDTAVFKTELEIIVFMQGIPEDAPYKHLYRIAFHQGLGALQWHFCRKKGEVPAETVVKSIMTDSYYRSLEHRGQIINSKTAREAAKYAKISLECARAVLNKDEFGNKDVEDLRIKFEDTRKNRTVEDLRRETGIEKVVH